MKLPGAGGVLPFAADGGNRDRVNHLFETAWIKGNRVHVTTTGGYPMETFSAYDRIPGQYPSYTVLFIHLTPASGQQDGLPAIRGRRPPEPFLSPVAPPASFQNLRFRGTFILSRPYERV